MKRHRTIHILLDSFPTELCPSLNTYEYYDTAQAPNLRTVTVERVSEHGIDFCLKRTSPIAQALGDKDTQVSFLYTRGSFVPGNSAEQWRGEGPCVEVDIAQVADLIPRFTLASIVGSTRFQKEKANQNGLGKGNLEPPQVSESRADIHTGKSRLTEIMLQTRNQVDAGEISIEELQECIKPMRLQPRRMECMIAGPETSIMWDRWEWLRIDDQGMDWNDPKHLVPH